jgi:hypothetical protein
MLRPKGYQKAWACAVNANRQQDGACAVNSAGSLAGNRASAKPAVTWSLAWRSVLKFTITDRNVYACVWVQMRVEVTSLAFRACTSQSVSTALYRPVCFVTLRPFLLDYQHWRDGWHESLIPWIHLRIPGVARILSVRRKTQAVLHQTV